MGNRRWQSPTGTSSAASSNWPLQDATVLELDEAQAVAALALVQAHLLGQISEF